MDLRVKYMVFCGLAECEAWLSHMEHNHLDKVEIKTPIDEDFEQRYPFFNRAVMDYSKDVFKEAIDILTKDD